MNTPKVAFAALLLVSAAASVQAGGYDTALMDPVVTAPESVAGISVSVCDDEPGMRRGCGGGAQVSRFASARIRDVAPVTPSEDAGGSGPGSPVGHTPGNGGDPVSETPDEVAGENPGCTRCDEWREARAKKREKMAWLDRPKWSGEKPGKARAERMWDRCVKEGRDGRS